MKENKHKWRRRIAKIIYHERAWFIFYVLIPTYLVSYYVYDLLIGLPDVHIMSLVVITIWGWLLFDGVRKTLNILPMKDWWAFVYGYSFVVKSYDREVISKWLDEKGYKYAIYESSLDKTLNDSMIEKFGREKTGIADVDELYRPIKFKLWKKSEFIMLKMVWNEKTKIQTYLD